MFPSELKNSKNNSNNQVLSISEPRGSNRPMIWEMRRGGEVDLKKIVETDG